MCSAFEAKEDLYQELLNKGRQLLALTPEGPDSNTEQDLSNLKDKWEAVQGKVAERKVRQRQINALLPSSLLRSRGGPERGRDSTRRNPTAANEWEGGAECCQDVVYSGDRS